jgi:oxygen-independent coproporphyrinogen III oxidase
VRRLSVEEEREEAWFLGLRLRDGVRWQDMQGGETFRPVVQELCELELVTDRDGVVRLTDRGVLFSNEVFERFLGVEV